MGAGAGAGGYEHGGVDVLREHQPDHGAGADYHPDFDEFAVEEVDADHDLVGVAMVTGHGATLRVDGDGTLHYDPRAALDGLGAGQSVVESFTYAIQDQDGEDAVIMTKRMSDLEL